MIQIAFVCFLALQAAQGEQEIEPEPCALYLSTQSAELLQECREAAEQGDADAQYKLGLMYAVLGEGVPQDRQEAAKWFRKAAEQGDAGAQLLLGAMYREGHGVPQDYREAVKWYRKAV